MLTALTTALRAVKNYSVDKAEFPSQQRFCDKQNTVAEVTGGHDYGYAQNGAFDGRLAGRTQSFILNGSKTESC